MTPRVATKRSVGNKGSSRSPYGPESEFSWFADQVAVAAERRQRDRNVLSPGVSDDQPEQYIPAPGGPDGDKGPQQRLEEARSRLKVAFDAERGAEFWGRRLEAENEAERMHPLGRHLVERRDLTTTAGAGGDFVPAGGVPLFIAEEFARAARNASVLLDTLRRRPLPETGMKLDVPRLATGASVAVQNPELTAVSETDPTTAVVSSPLSTIAGLVDGSRQLFDRALPGLDLVIAAESAPRWASK